MIYELLESTGTSTIFELFTTLLAEIGLEGTRLTYGKLFIADDVGWRIVHELWVWLIGE